MPSTRRIFLRSLLFTAVFAAGPLVQQPAPRPPGPPPLPDPWPDEPSREPPMPDPRRILEAKQEELKKESERLMKLAKEIHDELEKQSTADVLPLGLLKKAEEVEKIGKKMQSLLRG
jgi:hypothetical protein